MKKIFAKILIPIVVLGFFLAPVFSFPGKASAATLHLQVVNVANNPVKFMLTTDQAGSTPLVLYGSYDDTDGFSSSETSIITNITDTNTPVEITLNENLENGKQYYARAQIGTSGGVINYSNVVAFKFGDANSVNQDFKAGDSSTVPTPTSPTNDLSTINSGSSSYTGDKTIFNCDWVSLPCGATAAFYYLIFKPTAWIAGLAAQLMDWFIDYSVDSNSYNSPTISLAWGAVRDIANIFFIIALLYLAIQVILGVGHDAKKMIMWIILMGLLINFSLFVSQVVVDGTNILAKIFQNQGQDATTGENTDIASDSLSVKLVDKFHPQELLSKGEVLKNADTSSLSNFFLYTLLAVLVNCYMIYIFLSVSFLFVLRVAGLWISMIFAPIAFVSYALPFEIPGFGHKEWWGTLFKQAFLAPVFLFMLYIILLLADAANAGIAKTLHGGNEFLTNMQSFMKIFIPMMLLLVLLGKAKEMAIKFSGEMGSTISKLGPALVGVAAGMTGLGLAFAGRQTIGATAKYVQNQGARDKDFKTFGGWKDWSLAKKFNPLAYARQAGKFTTAGAATLLHVMPNPISKTPGQTVGGSMVDADKAYTEKRGSVSTLDSKAHDMAKGFGYSDEEAKNVKYKDLKEDDKAKVNEAIDKDTISKKAYGTDMKGLAGDVDKINSVNDAYQIPTTAGGTGRTIDPATGKMSFIIEAVVKNPVTGGIAYHTDGAQNVNGASAIKDPVTGKTIKEGSHISNYKASAVMGEFVQALRKGTMDLRNLADTKVTSKGFAKFAVGTTAIVAAGVRAGMQKGGMEHGTGAGSFGKDFSSMISEALKAVKVDVKVDNHGKVEAKGGGGGGHH